MMRLFKAQLVEAHYRPHQKLDAIALEGLQEELTLSLNAVTLLFGKQEKASAAIISNISTR